MSKEQERAVLDKSVTLIERVSGKRPRGFVAPLRKRDAHVEHVVRPVHVDRILLVARHARGRGHDRGEVHQQRCLSALALYGTNPTR